MMTTFLCVKFRTWIAFAEKATPADTPLILIIKLLFDMSVFVQTKRVTIITVEKLANLWRKYHISPNLN